MIKNEKGFTLIEIISVLVILGILAAVAVPKYIDLQTEARISAAQSAIAEIRAQANSLYAVKLLRTGSPPTVGEIVTSINAGTGTIPSLGPDFTLPAVTVDANSNITITVNSVRNISLSPAVVGTWFYPTAQ